VSLTCSRVDKGIHLSYAHRLPATDGRARQGLPSSPDTLGQNPGRMKTAIPNLSTEQEISA
jgi:hypothetical protein